MIEVILVRSIVFRLFFGSHICPQFAVFPNSLWYLSLDFVIGKLYANSLLATLNTRYSIRARGQGASSDSTSRSGENGPSLRIASGVDNRGAVFSTVIQVRPVVIP